MTAGQQAPERAQAQAQARAQEQRCFSVLLKPVGASCNLACTYCYYREKSQMLHGDRSPCMSEAVLEESIRQIIDMHGKRATIEFAWHGGEPLLAGRPFYEQALLLQKKHGAGRHMVNSIQTNATLLDEAWGRFLARHAFAVGVSVDGPIQVHDRYRRDAQGGGSLAAALRGVRVLQRQGLAFSTITVLSAAHVGLARQTYAFLKGFSSYMQFIPLFERTCSRWEGERGQHVAMPLLPGQSGSGSGQGGSGSGQGGSGSGQGEGGSGQSGSGSGQGEGGAVQPFSIAAADLGDFLCTVLDCWKEQPHTVRLQIVDVVRAALQGRPCGICSFEAICGHCLCVEQDGSVYPCDHFAYPEYRLGSVLTDSLAALAARNKDFGMHKIYGLPPDCLQCPFVKMCFGGCPKDRRTDGAAQGRNVFCQGYRQVFAHALSLCR